MKLNYVLLDPTGNMTILVETPVPTASQPLSAAALLKAEPTAEQVGFLSPGDGACDLSLRMAGGEFCGNAAMSAAALFCEKSGRSGTVRVRISGAAAPVAVEVTSTETGVFLGAVEMPRPAAPETVMLVGNGQSFCLPLVRFDGISHLIVRQPLERAFAERVIRPWCAELGADCLGLMLLDEPAGTLTPLVYVPGVDSLYWERSCASGTAAVGAFLAAERGAPVALRLAEPGGILGVSAEPGAAPILRGSVRLRKRARLDWESDAPYKLR